MSVRHVLTILATDHVEALAAFYAAALPAERAVETPVYVELSLAGGQRLGIYERAAYGRNVGRAPALLAPGELGPTELYFHADDLDAAIARFAEAGARPLAPRAARPWGDETAYFADPAGNVVALARPLG